MTDEVAELRRLLGWVYWRSRHGCASFKRSERDAALSDVTYWTERFGPHYTPGEKRISAKGIWCGDQP